ncbi:MAG: hypothetical protein QW818_03385 [Candidatus Aenigmatarchaeota archaeon]
MGMFGIIGKIIVFPFKLIFGGKKKETLEEPLKNPPSAYPTINLPSPTSQPTLDSTNENLKAKVDLMLTQIDSLKIEYEAINQRIQNIERMVRELYAMAKS